MEALIQQENHAKPSLLVEKIDRLRGADLHDLCDAADAAIEVGGGFGWVHVPARDVMENHWRGVLLIPERELFVARLDGTVAGSAQLVLPTKNNESAAATASLSTLFMAPWARGYGLALKLLKAVEKRAVEKGVEILQLDARETQNRAIQIYDNHGYIRWGTNPFYANVNGQWKKGYYYYKVLKS